MNAVVFAGLLHAAWNAVAPHITDRAMGLVLIGIAYTVLSAVVVPFARARGPRSGVNTSPMDQLK